MKPFAFLLALLSVVLSVSTLKGENYQYLTDSEHNWIFPDDRFRFFGRDTIWVSYRTNDCFYFQNGGPIVNGRLIMSCDSSNWPDTTAIPENIIFNAPRIEFPDHLDILRASPQTQHFSIPGEEWRLTIRGRSAFLYHYSEGTIFDSVSAQSINFALSPAAQIFVDGKLDIEGVIEPNFCSLIVGCSHDIRLIDNVMLEGTNPTNGVIPAGATSQIIIASEQGIYIANTQANGRENCTNGDHSNNNHARCHIIITAYLVALGTGFQFEDMNNVDDPYQGPSPDERGNIIFTGGMIQRYHGLVHRSNHNGTGYNKVYHWDPRMEHWRLGIFEPFVDHQEEYTDTQDHLFPEQFLLTVAPNPFNSSTTIRFTLPNSELVKARIYDIQGREIATIANQTYPAGDHIMRFDGAALSSGVYFISFQAGELSRTQKLLLLK